MNRVFSLFLALLLLISLAGCSADPHSAQIAATTLPVYEFTSVLCRGTDLTVTRLVTESVSCLHDYTLTVRQVKAAQAAETIVISGAGLESFLAGVIDEEKAIDASEGISLLSGEHHHDHEDSDEHEDHGEHEETQDPHIWLSPENAAQMAENICNGLCLRYPEYASRFKDNLPGLLAQLDALEQYGKSQLSQLSCRDIITFHDGFSYFAQAMDLNILAAVEEESGSEASAKDLKELILLVWEHPGCGIFVEKNGSDSAATVIAAETGVAANTLDMAMSGDSYFEAMYRNIDTIKEALS